jgi:Mrp family chromosome partitioning ATPase
MVGGKLTVREKIINWFKKLRITDYIKVEVAPAVTLFGIIKISFGKFKIERDPEKWKKEVKEEIANFLRSKGVGISLEEFEENLKEEIKKIPEKTQQLILNKIEETQQLILSKIELLVENPLVLLEEFEKRGEIKPLLEYKFIGRESELGELHGFLKSDKKVFVIVGEGGSGKTRLAIEFARQVANGNWNVYFIDRDKEFKDPVVSHVLKGKSALLILDEASRYPQRNKVIGFVQRNEDRNVKLLLLDRPVFRESIKTSWRKEEYLLSISKLGMGISSPF